MATDNRAKETVSLIHDTEEVSRYADEKVEAAYGVGFQ